MTNESDIVFVDAEHHSTGLIGSVLGSMGSMLWYSHWWLQRCVEDTNLSTRHYKAEFLRSTAAWYIHLSCCCQPCVIMSGVWLHRHSQTQPVL